jgi:hypothetical protein
MFSHNCFETQLKNASQAHFETQWCNASRHHSETQEKSASHISIETHEGYASQEKNETQGSLASHQSIETRRDNASHFFSETQEKSASHEIHDAHYIDASLFLPYNIYNIYNISIKGEKRKEKKYLFREERYHTPLSIYIGNRYVYYYYSILSTISYLRKSFLFSSLFSHYTVDPNFRRFFYGLAC